VITTINANPEGRSVQQGMPAVLNADPVLEEIGVQIDVLDTLGGQYARDYLAHALGITARPPTKPRGMHPLIAKALRDMAADEATAIRLYGPHRPRSDFQPGRRAPARPAHAERAA
jgi:hypothetical protein